MGFTHLHVHTEYSLLDGAAKIKDLIQAAKTLGMKSLAITDHGAMFGVIDFYREAKKEGIRPILGCEVYTAARTRHDKEVDKDKKQGHLVLLAKNNEGYKNLMKIVSIGYTEGFYYKPRIDSEVLRKYSNGIIALSACLAGDVQRRLLYNDYQGAKKQALDYLDIFGEGNFYLELQDQGLEEEARILPLMKQLHEETGIPFVATNDVHYVKKEDAEAQEILMCIQTGTTMEDPNRMRFENNEFYLKSEREMRNIFAAFPDAIDNTEVIANQCDVEIEFGKLHLPEFVAPDGKENQTYLRELCEKGLTERYKDILDSQDKSKELKDRLDYELSVIEQMGYVEYFLIVWDFINYAKTKGIMVGPGRGSAAGSIVAYSLRITDIDPIKYGLIFERFLNPERVSMPDIDIDFCYERRGEVIDYVIDKYGEDKVSQIITFGTMKAKAAIRDVGRVLNVSYAEVDALAKSVPADLKMTIKKALAINPELKDAYDNNPTSKKILDVAMSVEGMPRHASTHAAGVVISKNSLDEYVPLYSSDKGIATQFPMTTVEELGLLKMDFLGLRTLTVIRDAIKMIEENHNVHIDFQNISYDDAKVYQLISSGNTAGVFQLESAGMTQFMKNLNPDCFEDIIAGISLYRPGPMASIPTYIANKKNPSEIIYLHDSLKSILEVTYGCLVYQEQVMQIVRDLAGYSYGRSDLVRRAMGKKKMDVMLKEQENFINGNKEEGIDGCVTRGVPAEVAKEIFNQMISFAEYAFNKSHAAAYAVIAYQTAYLKTYYPVEFMAALMTSIMGDVNQTARYIENCKEMGIDVLPPSVLESKEHFTVKEGKIIFGLVAVKSVGEAAAKSIIKSREEKGLPRDIFEFINKLDTREVNKKAVEALIKAGALDKLNPNRAKHLSVYEKLMESVQSNAKKNLEGQLSLFNMDSARDTISMADIQQKLPDIDNFPEKQLLAMEKEMLGIYATGHPLKNYEKIISEFATISARDLQPSFSDESSGDNAEISADNIMESNYKDKEKVRLVGMVSTNRVIFTKANKMMSFLGIEDMYGAIEVIVFSNLYERVSGLLQADRILAISGELSFKEGEAPKIIAEKIVDIDDLQKEWLSLRRNEERSERILNKQQTLCLRINDKEMTEAIAMVKPILKKYKGTTPVNIYLDSGALRADADLWVTLEDAFLKEIKDLIGESNVKLK